MAENPPELNVRRFFDYDSSRRSLIAAYRARWVELSASPDRAATFAFDMMAEELGRAISRADHFWADRNRKEELRSPSPVDFTQPVDQDWPL